jgi:hypothetical protein
MKKLVKLSLMALIALPLLTGCGCDKKEEEKVNNNTNNQPEGVIADQKFEGLEFLNTGLDNGTITTIVINNTGVVYEGSKFSIKLMDNSGNVVGEVTDEVKNKMETGTTQTIETKTKLDLSKVSSIEYSIVK